MITFNISSTRRGFKFPSNNLKPLLVEEFFYIFAEDELPMYLLNNSEGSPLVLQPSDSFYLNRFQNDPNYFLENLNSFIYSEKIYDIYFFRSKETGSLSLSMVSEDTSSARLIFTKQSALGTLFKHYLIDNVRNKPQIFDANPRNSFPDGTRYELALVVVYFLMEYSDYADMFMKNFIHEYGLNLHETYVQKPLEDLIHRNILQPL